MNTEQTPLVEILWTSINPSCKGGIEKHLTKQGVNNWTNAAQAVATEVIKRLPEWGIIPNGEPTQEGDEKWFVSGRYGWQKITQPGWLVHGEAVRRRIVPTQQPLLGSPKDLRPTVQESPPQEPDVPPFLCTDCGGRGWVEAGLAGKEAVNCVHCDGTGILSPPPAPGAEWKPKVGDRVKVVASTCYGGLSSTCIGQSGEVLHVRNEGVYEVRVPGCTCWYSLSDLEPAPWKLPEPPPNMHWHRVDGWTQDMLPEGYRPLLLGEYGAINIDEFASYPNGVWLSVQATGPSVPGQLHTRTTRPLPAPSTPETEGKEGCLAEFDRLREERDSAIQKAKAWKDAYNNPNVCPPGAKSTRQREMELMEQVHSLTKERDAALARASELEKENEKMRPFFDASISLLKTIKSIP
jgi:hypothetical protein